MNGFRAGNTMKKKSKKKKEIKPTYPKKGKSDPMVEEDKPFDFGGLPDRPLKKNLGC